jgi:hypothetical protein
MAGVEALDRSNYCSQRRGRRRGLSAQGGNVQAEDSDSALPPLFLLPFFPLTLLSAEEDSWRPAAHSWRGHEKMVAEFV